ncbi:DUF3152 domain-containing protein [Streptomyces sp. NPDC088124]|uniref:DUF3152 domain-containing protein n=1 Tax=Streptomyces sp. NPDC088124 TaxID=3154654 RepID=UPI0034337814
MGRHSRKGPVPQGSPGAGDLAAGGPGQDREGPGKGRRRGPGEDHAQEQEQHGTPAHGTPVHGTPVYGTPAHGAPQVRGGHPEQRESGGGWGGERRYGDPRGAAPRGVGGTSTPLIPGPRKEFVDAFDAVAAPAATPVPRPVPKPGARGGDGTGAARGGPDATDDTEGSEAGPDAEEPARGGWGRALTGIAAAAVTTVLAVVVAGQVTGSGSDPSGARAAEGIDRADENGDGASRSDDRNAPETGEGDAKPPAARVTYEQMMARQFPLDPKLEAAGTFTAVPGLAKAPGKGQKVRYRVDIENGLGLDGALFAEAVQKTLNDRRSWAHNGEMAFERISSGEPDFVITLASPGTTAVWCAKSGLDTSIDNVSCDSAATDRVMINAFRWAQGAETFGAKAMFGYRQMLINHEIGHRLGHSHVNCRTPGALAPVMQQQTKTLDIDGVKCRPNPWVYPDE